VIHPTNVWLIGTKVPMVMRITFKNSRDQIDTDRNFPDGSVERSGIGF
jgi:hypothetical protein